MIWFILGIAPFVIGALLLLFKEPVVFFTLVGGTVLVMALILLTFYGAWQMNWFTHCGDFWESYSCP